MLARKTVFFTSPGQVEVREEPLPALAPDQVLVQTICSAISPGTELLLYRGEFPRREGDEHDVFGGDLDYPLACGYAAVGRVVETGHQVPSGWRDQLVFSFQPHTSYFATTPDRLLSAQDTQPENACFLPNMETAVNFVQDAAPLLGERVLVLGQGIVGLLTASLLVEFPLETLVTADLYPLRRETSLRLGAASSLDALGPDFRALALDLLGPGADLTVEVSGSPAALDDAIALTRFSGRVLIGSWYGEKQVHLQLGGKFHRSRIRLISSQVSSLAPELSSRWDKSRRFEVAWQALRRIRPEKWITHRFSIEEAQQAYRQLSEKPAETIQTILTYA